MLARPREGFVGSARLGKGRRGGQKKAEDAEPYVNFGVGLRHPNRLQIALFVVQLERPTVPKVLVLRRKTGVSRPFYGKSATFFCGESAEQDWSRSSRARARGFCYPAGRKTPRGNNGRWPAKGCDGTPAGLIEQLIPGARTCSCQRHVPALSTKPPTTIYCGNTGRNAR